ncbi:MAG: hypothetical protein IJD43_15390 [Thermoguttaceae bacterium]|nr:hypothetical protein [Thermoguttaceae bacterium]
MEKQLRKTIEQTALPKHLVFSFSEMSIKEKIKGGTERSRKVKISPAFLK